MIVNQLVFTHVFAATIFFKILQLRIEFLVKEIIGYDYLALILLRNICVIKFQNYNSTWKFEFSFNIVIYTNDGQLYCLVTYLINFNIRSKILNYAICLFKLCIQLCYLNLYSTYYAHAIFIQNIIFKLFYVNYLICILLVDSLVLHQSMQTYIKIVIVCITIYVYYGFACVLLLKSVYFEIICILWDENDYI
eukprot:TRINITY_DN11699_c0_g1_i2.p4 TRINITY_DN11699_c0_g1~~TRINITY_DN11699_c0_g1_i2.p4  ORF type:complete len:193 (-),score=-22.02 TRINITY_DN11699_c0_g1_i2:94-672(-)